MKNFIFDSTGKLSASIVGTSDITCDSQDLTLLAILSNGVATVRQTLSWVFSAMAAERAKKGRKLVLTPVCNSYFRVSHGPCGPPIGMKIGLSRRVYDQAGVGR